jgi:hypothetical protein
MLSTLNKREWHSLNAIMHECKMKFNIGGTWILLGSTYAGTYVHASKIHRMDSILSAMAREERS